MNQSKLKAWLKFFYRSFILGMLVILVLLSLALGIMMIDDLNLASIIIIVLVAALIVFLFRKIR